MALGENPGIGPLLEIRKAGDLLRGAQEHLALAHQALRPNPLPAPVLTEHAIVEALKADPGMAGRVIAKIANGASFNDRREMGHSARDWAMGHEHSSLAPAALANLAVALAAASYRGRRMTEDQKLQTADIITKAIDIMRASPSLAAILLDRYAHHISALSRYERDCVAERFDDIRSDPKSLEMLAGMIRRASK